MDKVRQVKEKAEQRRDMWDELNKLANEGNMKEFYSLYVKYLEFDGIISEGRQSIYKMAKMVVESLS